jgi:hypothetical protein
VREMSKTTVEIAPVREKVTTPREKLTPPRCIYIN